MPTNRFLLPAATLVLLIAACQKSGPAADETASLPDSGSTTASSGGVTPVAETPVEAPKEAPKTVVQAGESAKPKTNLQPPAPGEPGGLPNDKTPGAEGKPDPKGPQGAAAVVERYASLLEQGKYDEAYKMWTLAGNVQGPDAKAFRDRFTKYSEVHTMIGAPTDPEGAAGSSYITVPMQIYGRLKSGGTFNLVGPVILKRVNDVPGATKEQLAWHLVQSGLKPVGTVKEVPVP